mgnify:CR=1 FL=1
MAQVAKKRSPPAPFARARAGDTAAVALIPYSHSVVWAARAGIDICAIGDSLGMVSYGFSTTLPVTVDMMIEHCLAVQRGAPNTFRLVAMPYGSYAGPDVGVMNALRFMKEGGVDCVKMQGGRDKFAIIKAIADAGVPVMSHVGMCPHFVHQYGGFKLQGKTAEEAMKVIDDGLAIQEAGAIGFEIEAVPAPVARAVDAAVDVFTFGIGAGPASCGQLLLAFDLLGVFDQFKPKFTKRYANISEIAVDALKTYAAEVRSGQFPDADHSYGMKPEEEEKMKRLLARK